ncbi:spore coat associated protein CotJA [Clostridium sp. MCC353]|uniref:spore coat associated protein CotJA n=1 Tax=Clostridium sp. MCC353 TaxID=2592646 RepID=UPI001C02B310|nr:spore coat associated protein CotJA [Clostridium sp. MCC353]MBT9776040.1 spore coat associated protein CotJA [Clostridium sp. MCC353]
MDFVEKISKTPVHLAIATVPMQPWEQPYTPEKALAEGTIFPCLNLPFFIGGEAHD